MYYSAITGGFYDAAIHGDAIPADAVEITRAQHAALMAAQAGGKVIAPDDEGCPIAMDPPPPSVDPADYLARRRWEAEIGGTIWNGWHLPTDDRSQAKYLAELAAVNEGVRQDGQVWKFSHGFEALTNQQVRDMAVAARAHVLACFAKEAKVAAQIAAGTITTTAEIDAAFKVLP